MNKGLPFEKIDQLGVTTLRTLSMDAIQKSNSGHPGAPMGLAPAAYVLWNRILKHNPADAGWCDRDRFVLSGGHASMLLYSLLHLSGYDLPMEEIRNFRQWGSRTPGHPEYRHTQGVEVTTGPLGQGIANAVGMAMTERHLAACFNRSSDTIVDHYTYVMCGDGDMMEGVSSEAASLAGHLGLGRLICIYDDNKITIEGKTDIAFTENVADRFVAYGWHILRVEDGNDLEAIQEAILMAKDENEKPSLILLRTHIAYGSPHKQDTPGAHGEPLGADEVRLTKEFYGWPPDKEFYVPEEVYTHFEERKQAGMKMQKVWDSVFDTYSVKHPERAQEWTRIQNGLFPENWNSGMPDFSDPLATRASSGISLNHFAGKIPELIGGSADLAPSTKTIINASGDFQKGAYENRNIRFGVREHAMGAILNGMAVHGGVRPYGGTFLVFADYLRPSIRLAAFMQLSVIYVFTHDSVAVGEDGPTHQPVEHLMALRAIAGLTVIRPADALETFAAWQEALVSKGPVALILSRQKLPALPSGGNNDIRMLRHGAYIQRDCPGTPDILILASGSEVPLALEAAAELSADNIAVRVVSMPSWELFEKESLDYQHSVIPPDIKNRLAVEAGSPMGWEHYTGDAGAIIGISGYGASAPGGTVMAEYGFTAGKLADTARRLIKRNQV